ncbi:glycosyltransferase family 2 protein [Parapedobacter soli]|uniref:glycosyltransferase family 2 protein n=1 Tax=Parapedobacter soli TaxID=416955 RepID=UPI0021C8FA5F|nr:glycosyltransferase [Parapedobacter soli]
MTFSVVIPTYKRTDLLATCLAKLSPDMQKLDAEDYEVIVTDDSDEEEAKWLVDASFPSVRWIKGPGKGPAANRNHGARAAKGKWIVFTDDDCIPTEGWLAAYKSGVLNTGGRYQVFEGKTISDRPQRRYDEESPINLTGGHLWSCNFAIKKTLFEQTGGFDEGFPFAAMEDVDFQYRVAKLTGYQFLPDAIIVHPWRRINTHTWLRKQYHSRVYFYRKHRTELGFRYRFNMIKSFVVTMTQGAFKLVRFSFKGLKFYLFHCLLRFSLIFA